MEKPISVTWEVSTSNADEYDKDWKASAKDDLSDMGIKPKQQSQLTMKATLADKQYEDEMYVSFYDVTVTGPVELIDKMKKWLRKEDMLGADESMKAKKMIEAVRSGQNPKKVLECGMEYQATATDRVRQGKIPTDIIDKVVAMVKSDEGDFAEIKVLLRTWASEATKDSKSNGVDDTGEMELAYAKLFRAVAAYFDQPW